MCGSLFSATTTTPGVADDGGDAPVKDSLPIGGSNAPPCAQMAWEASHTNALVGTNANQRIRLRYSCLNSGQLTWGIVRSGNWRHFQIMPMAFHQNSIFIHCSLLITKIRLDCASQPANLDALVNGISVILGSYGHLLATIPVPTRQLTELYTRWMASIVTYWWWMSSCNMHGCSYVHLRSHPLMRCLHFYGYLASQMVESYNVTKAVNLPKAQGGARIC